MIDGNTIEWLKKNLKITITKNDIDEVITVELILDGDVISSDTA